MADDVSLYDRCRQSLYLHGKQTVADIYLELARYSRKHKIDPDHYGEGSFLNRFEQRVADMLGKQAALFMPSGVMAQQIALRIHADQAGLHQVAFHPTCHMEINEHHGYRFLHGLQASLAGERHLFIRADDLNMLDKPVSTLLLELPQRWCGGLLPDRDALSRVIRSGRRHAQYIHLDGARLWECTNFYDAGLQKLSDEFDSVYVSFYKTLGGISGAILAGETGFVDEAKIWLRRHGGNLYQLHPYAASASLNLDKRLPLIPAYVERAGAIAKLLDGLPFIIYPDPPMINMFHVHIPFPVHKLQAARDHVAKTTRIWMAGRFYPSYLPAPADPQGAYMEVHVGDVLLNMPDHEILEIFETFRQYLESA